jgi:hypothetical protein
MDIQTALNELQPYLSDGAIAEAIGGVRLHTIWRLRTGRQKNTSYEKGQKILALHDKLLGKRLSPRKRYKGKAA